jgi:hypothetical protein
MKCCFLSLRPRFLFLIILFYSFIIFISLFLPLSPFPFVALFHSVLLSVSSFFVFFQGLGIQSYPASDSDSVRYGVTEHVHPKQPGRRNQPVNEIVLHGIKFLCLIHSVRPKKWNTNVWRIRPKCDQDVDLSGTGVQAALEKRSWPSFQCKTAIITVSNSPTQASKPTVRVKVGKLLEFV